MRLFFLHNKRVFYGIISILILILVVLATIAFTPNIARSPKTTNLCASFPKESGEISCEEAKNISIKRFPGVIKGIRKNTDLVPAEKSSKPKMAERKLWLVLVHLDKPQESPVFPSGKTKLYSDIEVGIERTTGKVIMYRNI